MAVYKIRGRRFLKKYSAVAATPAYAASTDAQAIADNLCVVPWVEVQEAHAQMTYHTNEMLDRNIEIRNRFDAAAFCASHSDGMHRAFANAACYVFELPEMAEYPDILSLKARVVSDPYNSSGVRLAVHVSDSLDIPVDCAVARTGVAHVAGVVPREARVAADKKTYWYAATGEVVIPVAVRARRYLMLVVALEDYSRSRGDWIEGSAYILPTIEIETSGELSSWRDDIVNEDVGGREFVVREPGSRSPIDPEERASLAGGEWKTDDDNYTYKYDQSILAGDWYCASPRVEAGEDNTLGIIGKCEKWSRTWQKDLSPGFAGGVQACYAAFMADKMWPVASEGQNNWAWVNASTGPAFYVGENCGTVSMARRRFLVPMLVPAGFRAKALRLSWKGEDRFGILHPSGILRNVWLLRGEFARKYRAPELIRHEFFDASSSRVGDWELVASIKDEVGGASAGVDFPIELDSHGPHTLLLTCFIDISEFDLDGEPKAYGVGYDNIAAIDTGVGIAIQCGIFEGQWDPKISLIG